MSGEKKRADSETETEDLVTRVLKHIIQKGDKEYLILAGKALDTYRQEKQRLSAALRETAEYLGKLEEQLAHLRNSPESDVEPNAEAGLQTNYADAFKEVMGMMLLTHERYVRDTEEKIRNLEGRVTELMNRDKEPTPDASMPKYKRGGEPVHEEPPVDATVSPAETPGKEDPNVIRFTSDKDKAKGWEYYLNEAQKARTNEDYTMALAYASEAEKLAPSNARVNAELGFLYLMAGGNEKDAMKSLEASAKALGVTSPGEERVEAIAFKNIVAAYRLMGKEDEIPEGIKQRAQIELPEGIKIYEVAEIKN